jgi:hypothetical protein
MYISVQGRVKSYVPLRALVAAAVEPVGDRAALGRKLLALRPREQLPLFGRFSGRSNQWESLFARRNTSKYGTITSWCPRSSS